MRSFLLLEPLRPPLSESLTLSSSVLRVCQVTVSVNGGKGETSASFIPEEPLCDGRWHSISGEFRPRAPCTALSLYRSNAEMSLQW